MINGINVMANVICSTHHRERWDSGAPQSSIWDCDEDELF